MAERKDRALRWLEVATNIGIVCGLILVSVQIAQEREIAKHAKQESLRLPEDIDYGVVDGLSNEARQRLQISRPVTLGQASRLEGMTPSAVSLILIHLKKRQLRKSA